MQPLQHLHTFALPATCQRLITVDDIQLLEQIVFQTPFYILGEGSNSIFLEDFQGTVILMRNKGISVTERGDAYLLEVAAGENWHELVLWTLAQGMAGLENLALIPGTVGAAPVQNIGAYGVELEKFVEYVEGFDIGRREWRRLSRAQCQFAYRDSIFKHQLKDRLVITSVGLRLDKHWLPTLSYGPLAQLPQNATAQQICDAVIAIRQSKLPDPQVLPNAGSFFKNPIVSAEFAADLKAKHPTMPLYPVDATYTKLAAGWLIEQAGLKGYCQQTIRVYEQQALVLVNGGEGQGEALHTVILHVQRTVFERFAVALEHEVRLLGATGEVTIGHVVDAE
ncbi:UDP-N-acetylmuramate dehydrogenase [Pseudoalteromonas fenneropenaei]|uniref:UDP-N-acetylenolpyruvoylglucosamine reductase n=1 Tax=Pseudoalteromonas fenneropenaei TaxID=1737459 RepID=A0ABV7CQ08_9GAMM